MITLNKALYQLIKTKYPTARILKVGAWHWVFFEVKPDKDIRDKMKENKGFYNGKRACWQFSNGHKSIHSRCGTDELLIKYRAKDEVLA